MGIILKLIDNGYYEAFGRNIQVNSNEFATEEWEPIMNQALILAYVALSVGLILAILTFIIEVLSGQKKQGLRMGLSKHRDVTQRHAWKEKGMEEPTRLKKRKQIT